MLAMTPLLFVSGFVDTKMRGSDKKNKKHEGSEILSETLNSIKVVRSLNCQE